MFGFAYAIDLNDLHYLIANQELVSAPLPDKIFDGKVYFTIDTGKEKVDGHGKPVTNQPLRRNRQKYTHTSSTGEG